MPTADVTAVRVPDTVGPEIVVRFGGDDPETYRVTNGSVEVPNARVERFLAAVDGASVEGTPTAEAAPAADMTPTADAGDTGAGQ